MNLFSISDLQNYSGVKAHTIRIWEQRYNALKPERSEGNTRYYDDKQLRRLLNIVSLMNNGYRVSELCSMPDEKHFSLLNDQYLKTISQSNPYEFYISQLVSSAIEFDESSFNKLYANCLLRFGISDTYRFIIHPALERFGLMWAKASLQPAQEHFISSLIRQKILAATDAVPLNTLSENKWLLFLPEDEFHETGLLFSNFLIRHYGHKVYYIGSNVPFDTLLNTTEKLKPTRLLFFLVHNKDIESDYEYFNLLENMIPVKKIFAACSSDRFNGFNPKGKLKLLHSLKDLETVLNS